MGSSNEAWEVENGIVIESSDEIRHLKAAHAISSSSLRKKSDLALGLNARSLFLRGILINLQKVMFGAKICILFVAVPFAIVSQYCDFGRVSIILFRCECLENASSNMITSFRQSE